MALSLQVGKLSFEIGNASFLKSFFSTIYIHLEEKRWGSRFPTIMNEFYSGRLEPTSCGKANDELQEIRRHFQDMPPERVVWNFENLDERPPWGDNISPVIASLANYFWTSDGNDLFAVLTHAFKEGQNKKKIVEIR